MLSALGGGMPGVVICTVDENAGYGRWSDTAIPSKARPVSQGQYQPARSLLEERQMMPSRRRIFLL